MEKREGILKQMLKSLAYNGGEPMLHWVGTGRKKVCLCWRDASTIGQIWDEITPFMCKVNKHDMAQNLFLKGKR